MKTIGRREYIDLPDLNLYKIDAKIDTGAYSGALHCHHIEVVEQDSEKFLRFQLLDPTHPEYEDVYCYSREFRMKKVRSSSGESQDRYTIKTRISIFGKTYRVELSLTNRKDMRYPVLIGRKFLRKKFVVDVSKKYLSPYK